MNTVRGFVRKLQSTPTSSHAFNQYAGNSQASARKRHNLRIYLSRMLESEARTILVGEAPSYRGGRLTGIPFLSETLMLGGVPGSNLFGRDRGFRRATTLPRLSTEASATIVWGVIGRRERPPLLWNAFPFHPHRGSNSESNRPPTRDEILVGQPFLMALLELFEIQTVVAVGNHASVSLTELGVRHEKVRHPANGGKKKFVEGIDRICQNRSV